MTIALQHFSFKFIGLVSNKSAKSYYLANNALILIYLPPYTVILLSIIVLILNQKIWSEIKIDNKFIDKYHWLFIIQINQ